MKPLIERLKEERADMLAKLAKNVDRSRELKLKSRAEPDEEARLKIDRHYAQVAHTVKRIEARLSELKAEIIAENNRLTAALREQRALNRKLARTGSIYTPDGSK